jgi:hypothetical protein
VDKSVALGSLVATRQLLQSNHKKFLVVDLLSTVVDLERRTRSARQGFVLGGVMTFLLGIGTAMLGAIQSPVLGVALLLLLLAMGYTGFSYVVSHQLARAWLRIWGEMGLLR